MLQLPRVLIFGQPFNNRFGGGITLSNLFREWDKDKLAVAATGHVMYHVTTDVCDNYYQLGIGEFKWRFPFNLIQRKFQSGVLKFEKEQNPSVKKRRSEIRHTIVNKFFYPALEWLGLFHALPKMMMTAGFKELLSDFNPEVLYLQVSTRDTVLLAIELIDYLKVPSVIHVMDDWPSTISKNGLLKRFWYRKIDNEFKSLLVKVDFFLSISDAMSAEYKARYGKEFIAFHNPIDIQLWTINARNSYKIEGDYIKVLFSGRIGIGVAQSLLDLGEVIENLSNEGIKIKLHIQSTSSDKKVLNELKNLKSLVINPVAEYSELPVIFSDADILVIANDFDQGSISYLKYSMPTKASEYMISGTPVLVYSHESTAVSRFFSENKCGCCVSERNLDKLKDALISIIENESYRHDIGTRAVIIAAKLFDAKIVRMKFQNMIRNALLTGKNN